MDSPDDAVGAAADGPKRGHVFRRDLKQVPKHVVLDVPASMGRDALDVPLPGGGGGGGLHAMTSPAEMGEKEEGKMKIS